MRAAAQLYKVKGGRQSCWGSANPWHAEGQLLPGKCWLRIRQIVSRATTDRGCWFWHQISFTTLMHLTAALSWVLPATDAKNGQTPTSANSTVHVHWCILLKPGLLPSLSFYCAAVAPLSHLAFVTSMVRFRSHGTALVYIPCFTILTNKIAPLEVTE